MKQVTRSLLSLLVFALVAPGAPAQVPGIINYQGRVIAGNTNFTGTGQFKFALVNGSAGTTNYWSNNGTAIGQPAAAVSLTVTKGLYAVLLGDTTIANMTVAVAPAVFANADVRLRIWFNDGVSGFQQLSPDQRISAAGYALIAASVSDGVITSNKLALGAVGPAQLATGAVTAAVLAPGSVGSAQLAVGAVTAANIAGGQVVKSLNGLMDNVTLVAGTNVTLTPSGNNLTISSAGAGGSGIWSLNGSSTYYNGGNVGIWTATPVWPLDIQTSYAVARLVTTNGGYGGVLELRNNSINSTLLGAINFNNAAGTYPSQIACTTDSNLTFGVGGGERLRITGAGNIGIGTTTPKETLHVVGQAVFTGNSSYDPGDGSGPAIRIGYNTDGYGFINANNTGVASENLVLEPTSGYVGIGTTAPQQKLSVNYGMNIDQADDNNGSLDNDHGLSFGSNSAEGIASKRTAGGNQWGLDFYTGHVQRMSINNNGYVGIGTNTPGAPLTVAGTQQPMAQLINTNGDCWLELHGGGPGCIIDTGCNSVGGIRFKSNYCLDDAKIYYCGGFHFLVDGTENALINYAGLTVNGTTCCTSDRNAKERFEPIDVREVLNRVASLPISRWSYKQDADTRHLGPVSQDFYAAFKIGPDDKHIATVDEEGVALAAIQGLNQKLEETVKAKDARITDLERRLADLERLVKQGGK